MRQQCFKFKDFKALKEHGGGLARGKRKTRRPLDVKQALQSPGDLSLLHPRHCNRVEAFVRKIAEKHGVRLYRFVNVGNHIHVLLRARSRQAWQRFSKEVSGDEVTSPGAENPLRGCPRPVIDVAAGVTKDGAADLRNRRG